jgi:hypothetical protein
MSGETRADISKEKSAQVLSGAIRDYSILAHSTFYERVSQGALLLCTRERV